jgi:hypothetical protein
MMIAWTERDGGLPVAVSWHAPAGPVCILSVVADDGGVSVSFCRVKAARHEDVLAVLTGRPKTGREVARLLGIAPTTANARLNDLLEWGMAQSRAHGRSIMWSFADGG